MQTTAWNPPEVRCPHCGNLHRAIVCNICKVPVGEAPPTTPDGKPLQRRMCTCAQHCTNSPYHERACCEGGWCDCWCHADEYRRHNRRPPAPAIAAMVAA